MANQAGKENLSLEAGRGKLTEMLAMLIQLSGGAGNKGAEKAFSVLTLSRSTT